MQPAVNDFRNSELALALVQKIKQRTHAKAHLMEFCGSHTAAILKYGLRQLLPRDVEMLSGPGCPVCVTDQQDIDRAIALAQTPGIIMCTFGDMLKVPGTYASLQQARAEGCDVRTVYSTLDALEIARQNTDKPVVFLGVGFETTAPTIAASIALAKSQQLRNYSVFSLAKLCPPVMKALLDGGEIKIDGIICPGHVSAIIGSHPYEFIVRDYGIACVVAGFEPVDILMAVDMLLAQMENGRPQVEIAYGRSVSPEGNKRAQELLSEVFEPQAARWRGVGTVGGSGYKICDAYKAFDAERLFEIKTGPAKEPAGCRCGDVLRGIINPPECPLFGRICLPERPTGPCMVSGEGACASYYLFGETISAVE
ncbi:MAG: hydrogenase formation protein HypD [Dehalococcoidia bacterium]|nr:hydrogenase formation protein HypD [Dehalococcoidia bacterium]